MIGLLIPVVLATAVARLRVGSFTGLRRLRIRWGLVALAALVFKIVLFDPPVSQQQWAIAFGPALWVGSMAAIFVVLVRNAFEPGPARVAFQLAALGLGLNLLVVVANGGYMPQSPDAHVAVWGSVPSANASAAELHNVAPAGPDVHLGWLGDMIPQPRWLPKPNVISIGDVILSLAAAGMIALTIGRRETQFRGTPADS